MLDYRRVIKFPCLVGQHTSERGIEHIRTSEGLRLDRYIDPVGVATIGYGHTGLGVRKARITKEEAEKLLMQDIKNAERGVRVHVKVKLTQGQFDALVSFVFNFGAYKFRKSTLLRKLNAADYQGAANEFPRWVHGKVNGKWKRLKGLEIRRAHEQEMFLDGIT